MKNLKEWVSIEYYVNQNQYFADVYLEDLVEAHKEGGYKAVSEYIEEAVEEAFNCNVYYSYDLDSALEELNEEYGTELGEDNEQD